MPLIQAEMNTAIVIPLANISRHAVAIMVGTFTIAFLAIFNTLSSMQTNQRALAAQYWRRHDFLRRYTQQHYHEDVSLVELLLHGHLAPFRCCLLANLRNTWKCERSLLAGPSVEVIAAHAQRLSQNDLFQRTGPHFLGRPASLSIHANNTSSTHITMELKSSYAWAKE